jgi:hypothetical protein
MKDLTEDEEFSLKYMNINPHCCIIWDDVLSDLRGLKREGGVIDDIFTKGRHMFVTLIAALQNDTTLTTTIRKAVMVNIFTTQVCVVPFFDRKVNGFSKETRKRAQEACHEVWPGGVTFKKLMYIRKVDEFFRVTAVRRDKFVVGSPVVNKYCDLVAADTVSTAEKSNAYHKLFR